MKEGEASGVPGSPLLAWSAEQLAEEIVDAGCKWEDCPEKSVAKLADLLSQRDVMVARARQEECAKLVESIAYPGCHVVAAAIRAKPND